MAIKSESPRKGLCGIALWLFLSRPQSRRQDTAHTLNSVARIPKACATLDCRRQHGPDRPTGLLCQPLHTKQLGLRLFVCAFTLPPSAAGVVFAFPFPSQTVLSLRHPSLSTPPFPSLLPACLCHPFSPNPQPSYCPSLLHGCLAVWLAGCFACVSLQSHNPPRCPTPLQKHCFKSHRLNITVDFREHVGRKDAVPRAAHTQDAVTCRRVGTRNYIPKNVV